MTTLNAEQPAADPKAWQNHAHQPHWRNAEDEFDAAKLGMWLFLATEVLLFGGMFCAWAILHHWYPEAFKGASAHYLSWKIGAANTAVLLLSSFTVAWGVRNAQLNQQGLLKANLLISIICGVFFLVVKITMEYIPKIQKGELPGAGFTYAHGEHAHEPIFLSIYWVSTAIHGFHVLVGVAVLLWLFIKASKGHFGPKYYTPIEVGGLYWHLVDLIWIFLFPLLYLV